MGTAGAQNAIALPAKIITQHPFQGLTATSAKLDYSADTILVGSSSYNL